MAAKLAVHVHAAVSRSPVHGSRNDKPGPCRRRVASNQQGGAWRVTRPRRAAINCHARLLPCALRPAPALREDKLAS